MRIEPIEYMEWAKLHPRAKINLSRSGRTDRSLADLRVDLTALEVNGVSPYGQPALLAALGRRYNVPEASILTTGGASQAIFMVCAALLEAGDRVLVERPAYEPLLAVPRLLGAEILRLERRYEEGYRIDFDRLHRALELRPKLILLTDLHNPSGVWLGSGTLREVASAAASVGAMVFVDEIYLEFTGDDPPATAFSAGENVIAASSLTKAYGLGGLRCGWVFAPLPLAGTLRRLMDHLNVEEVFIGEQIASMVIGRLAGWTAAGLPALRRNLALVRDFIGSEDKLSWVEPESGIVCFPRIEAGIGGTELAAILEERYDTTVVPGRFFEEPRHFRLGFGGPEDELAEGLENIHRALEGAAPGPPSQIR
jgi:aspartate/methionine/tyrosine aminotransferase